MGIIVSVDAASSATSSEKISDAQTANGMKDPVCLVDIPMPSSDESQIDKTTSKEGVAAVITTSTTTTTITNTSSIPSPGETKINSFDKTQFELHRKFNLISVPPPPPPTELKCTFSSNIVINTHRSVNYLQFKS